MNKVKRSSEYLLKIANTNNEEIIEDIFEILEEYEELVNLSNARNDWIPVTERLPERFCQDGILYNHQRVLATLKNGCVCEMWWGGANENFTLLEGFKRVELTENPVIAWRLMPKGYLVED